MTTIDDHHEVVRRQAQEIAALRAEEERLQRWVNDLQAGMYINCVYCGHRYGPDDEVPATMAQVLKDHIEQCPKHPMSTLKAGVRALAEALNGFVCHYPGGINPYLDLAYAKARAALAREGVVRVREEERT